MQMHKQLESQIIYMLNKSFSFINVHSTFQHIQLRTRKVAPNIPMGVLYHPNIWSVCFDWKLLVAAAGPGSGPSLATVTAWPHASSVRYIFQTVFVSNFPN